MYYYQENKEEIKKKQAVYRKDNPHIFAKIGAKRRARKINQTPTDLSTLESSMIEALYFMSRVLSKSCGEPFHIDHITPLSKGGQHKFDNLQILSAEQNLRKGNR
jgi:5-methylcytosine-specific restriction endonuclease McrA